MFLFCFWKEGKISVTNKGLRIVYVFYYCFAYYLQVYPENYAFALFWTF